MLASEMIPTITRVEKENHGINWLYASRIRLFQRRELSETQGVIYNEPFYSDFVRAMEKEIGGKINRPTAKKIVNNWNLRRQRGINIKESGILNEKQR